MSTDREYLDYSRLFKFIEFAFLVLSGIIKKAKIEITKQIKIYRYDNFNGIFFNKLKKLIILY